LQSFSVQTQRPEALIEATLRHAQGKRSKGIVFLSGALSSHAGVLAEALAANAPQGTWLIASAAGVLSENGELEGESAAVGMKLPTSASVILGQRADAAFGTRLGDELIARPGGTACVLLGTPFGQDEWLDHLRVLLRPHERHVFGGGTLPGQPIVSVEAGSINSGLTASLLLRGSSVSRLCSSSACRLLSPVGKVTKSQGPVIFEIDGGLALERLAESTAGLEEQTLVLLALAGDDRPLSARGRTLALTPIQGVDPGRGTILAGEEIPEGTPIAFAVRDAHRARADFEQQLRTLKSQGAGTAPGFGLYISCAGRGRSLYKSQDVDTRLIVSQFPSMPFVGMHSTFEIAPLQDRLTPQVYAGVLGVFSLPS
jgi:small ligand-binding sensory domain FIST